MLTGLCREEDDPITVRPPLLIFSDDWGRHPSSCQHLARQWLERHGICWVNTIGTRPPSLDLATLRRALEKIGQWSGRSSERVGPSANLRVLNPRMWPWFRSRFDRRLNYHLLLHQLRPLFESLPSPPVVVTTIPIVADLVGAVRAARWVYYCVDDFGQWPGLDRPTLRTMEERLVQQADVVIAVSETLRTRLAVLGREAQLLTHGVDLEHWSGRAPTVTAAAAPLALDGLERPLIVFWGLVDRRMDTSFVERLAGDLTRGTILFVGPEDDPDPGLARLGRVERRAPVPFAWLPELARAAEVLIMPYADLPVTRAMQPLKLKEYLATGKPVVVRDLAATREWADCLDLADTPEAFSRAVRSRLEGGLPEGQRIARERLKEESWAGKARLFERWAFEMEQEAAPSLGSPQ